MKGLSDGGLRKVCTLMYAYSYVCVYIHSCHMMHIHMYSTHKKNYTKIWMSIYLHITCVCIYTKSLCSNSVALFLLTRGWGSLVLETRPLVALGRGSCPELSTFNLSLAPPAPPCKFLITDTDSCQIEYNPTSSCPGPVVATLLDLTKTKAANVLVALIPSYSSIGERMY